MIMEVRLSHRGHTYLFISLICCPFSDSSLFLSPSFLSSYSYLSRVFPLFFFFLFPSQKYSAPLATLPPLLSLSLQPTCLLSVTLPATVSLSPFILLTHSLYKPLSPSIPPSLILSSISFSLLSAYLRLT